MALNKRKYVSDIFKTIIINRTSDIAEKIVKTIMKKYNLTIETMTHNECEEVLKEYEAIFKKTKE